MPPIIQLLGREVIEKVAAGEVIERPASVIKELVENSLDASSTRISVEIQGGGIDLIKVSDNGIGILRDELVLAFTRHATSKITTLEDLYRLNTLGFRGEALSSIAAVAKVQASSRRYDKLEGYKILIEHHIKTEIAPVGMPIGTSIIAKDLFYNTPARRKFLKSPSRETSIITDLIERFVLTHPSVGFSYIADGREVLITPEGKTMRAAAGYVYNPGLAQQLIEFYFQDDKLEIRGLISPPWNWKTNKSYYTAVVNKRYIKNRLINQAVEEAWGGPGDTSKYPVFILHLSMPPDFFDVNVHPQKTEIKFVEENKVYDAVFKSISSAMQNIKPAKEANDFRTVIYEIPFSAGKQSKIKDVNGPRYAPNSKDNNDDPVVLSQDSFFSSSIIEADNNSPHAKSMTKTLPGNTIELLQPIGQLHGRYLLAEGGEGLYIIDPHAAHERILYEKYISESQQSGAITCHNLLIPETVTLNTLETQLLIESLPKLSRLGFTIEYFGNTTFVIRAVPTGLDCRKGEVFDLITRLITSKHQIASEDFFIEGLKMLACTHAIKLGKPISHEEWVYFLEKLSNCKEPYHCPHGRPTIILLNHKELTTRFLRQ